VTTPQDKDWAVMTAAEQITADEKRQAQITFTVTNLQRQAASVTTTVVADDVAANWFTIDRPVRYIDRGDSAQFVVRAVVPELAPAADYSFQLLAYSSDIAPEERPTYSSQVRLRVPAKPPRPRRLKLILLLAGIVLVVASLVTTLVVVLTREDEPPQVLPSATPSLPAVVRVPSLRGLNDPDVISAKLAEVGLVADITFVHSTQASGVIDQQPTPLEEVTPGSVVAVQYAIALTAPTDLQIAVTLQPKPIPQQGPVPPRTAAEVEISWQQPEPYIRSWQVVFASNVCFGYGYGPFMALSDAIVVNATTVRVTRHYVPIRYEAVGWQAYSCDSFPERVYVQPLDDLGVPGPYVYKDVSTSTKPNPA
jgi:hypothetical protein